MISYPVKENHNGSVVSVILRYIHKDRHRSCYFEKYNYLPSFLPGNYWNSEYCNDHSNKDNVSYVDQLPQVK